MHSNHNNEPLHGMQDLAQHRVEARLQREADKVLLDQIASLESQVATLTEACSKKDEALRELLDDNSDDNYCESTCACVGHESDCEFSEEQCRTKWRNLVIAHALSLTPASVAQRAEEATTAYRQTDDDYNTWECEKCHEVWCFNEGTPKDNEWRYCPKCGRRVVEVIAKARGEQP